MLTEDLSVFFNPSDFAVTATYNGATSVNGIFDSPDLGVLGVGGDNPSFMCKASDVAADPTGKTLVVNGTTYTIRDIRPQDDATIVQLQLERA